MKIHQESKNLILKDCDSFDIEDILECGQCFRFEKLGEKEYTIVAFEKELQIKQTEEEIIFYNTNESDFKNIWFNYFDLGRNYSEIKKILRAKDLPLKNAVDFGRGIRILNQDPWECLISFIISQNNRIPMIKKVIQNLSETYGKKISNYYSFPTPESIVSISEEKLMECKTGFRAKYILDATNKIINKEIELEKLFSMSTKDAREELLKIHGVGPKVADCVLLFSFGKADAFPTDVWVKRVMQHFYFEEKDTPIKEITSFAEKEFGDLAGFAQQYLFHFARLEKIGTK